MVAKSKSYVYSSERDASGKLVKKYIGRANEPHVQAILEVKRLQEAQQQAADEADLERQNNFAAIASELALFHRAVELVASHDLKHEWSGFAAK